MNYIDCIDCVIYGSVSHAHIECMVQCGVHTVAQIARLHFSDAVDERVQPLVLGATLIAGVARAPAAASELRDVSAGVAQAPLEHPAEALGDGGTCLLLTNTTKTFVEMLTLSAVLFFNTLDSIYIKMARE